MKQDDARPDPAALIAALGLRLDPAELARVIDGVRADIAAAQRLRDWLSAQDRA